MIKLIKRRRRGAEENEENMEEMIEDKKWLVLLLMKSFCISASAKLIINFLQHLDELSAVE